MRTSIKLFALTLTVAAAGCYPSQMGPQWPVTQTAKPFDRPPLDSAQKGQAPAVADAVTFERIVGARSEPHNWLTYYGAYDGQRFSALDQVNTSSVSRLRPAWVFQSAPIGLMATPPAYSFTFLQHL